MFRTIAGHERGVFYISSIKKDPATNTLVFYLMNGGSIKEQYGSADEMENTYQEYMDLGFFVPLYDRIFNTIHFSTVGKFDIDGRYQVHIVIRTGETIIGDFDTEAERDAFYELIMEASFGGGLVQENTFADFPPKGKDNVVYLARDTGQTYYWDETTQTYVKTGTAGRTGVYTTGLDLPPTIGSTITINKSDLTEILAPTVPYSDGSEVIGNNSVHGIIVSSTATTVEVKTITDLVIDSFQQVDDLTKLPSPGIQNILYYVKDIDEFRIWDDTISDYVEPFHPIVFNSGTSVTDARLNTLYVEGEEVKYTLDNLNWIILNDKCIEEYVQGKEYEKDKIVYLGKTIALTLNSFTSDTTGTTVDDSFKLDETAGNIRILNRKCVFEYKQGEDYKEGELVYLDNLIARVVSDFTSDITGSTVQDSYELDEVNGKIIILNKKVVREYVQGEDYKKDEIVYLNDLTARVMVDFTADTTQTNIDDSFELDEDNGNIVIFGGNNIHEYVQGENYKQDELVYLGDLLARVKVDFTSDTTGTTVDDSFKLDETSGNIIIIGKSCIYEYKQGETYKAGTLVYLGDLTARVVNDFTSDTTGTTVDDSFEIDETAGNIIVIGKKCIYEYVQGESYKKDELVYLNDKVARVVNDFTSDTTGATVNDSFNTDETLGNIIPISGKGSIREYVQGENYKTGELVYLNEFLARVLVDFTSDTSSATVTDSYELDETTGNILTLNRKCVFEYIQGSDYKEGDLVYLDDRLARVLVDFTSDTTLTNIDDSFELDETSGNITILSADVKQLTTTLTFDGTNVTFNLPNDLTGLEFQTTVNGLNIFEGVDYTVNRIVTPNTITFDIVYDTFDRCTFIYLKK